MAWVVGAVVLVALVVLVDRAAVWAERRGWIYWRHRPRGGASGVLGELESVLSPSYRHVVEETQAKQILRLDQASGDDSGAIVVDLVDGTARIVGEL